MPLATLPRFYAEIDERGTVTTFSVKDALGITYGASAHMLAKLEARGAVRRVGTLAARSETGAGRPRKVFARDRAGALRAAETARETGRTVRVRLVSAPARPEALLLRSLPFVPPADLLTELRFATIEDVTASLDFFAGRGPNSSARYPYSIEIALGSPAPAGALAFVLDAPYRVRRTDELGRTVLEEVMPGRNHV